MVENNRVYINKDYLYLEEQTTEDISNEIFRRNDSKNYRVTKKW